MDDNNDFVQKFNYSKRSHNNISATIITSFISAIIGGACALRNIYRRSKE